MMLRVLTYHLNSLSNPINPELVFPVRMVEGQNVVGTV